MKISAQAAIVTGGASGLGEATARQPACDIVTNGHLNGEVIRIDCALRMAPR